MTKTSNAARTNSLLDVFRRAHARASDYLNKSSVWLLLSALALRDVLRGEELRRHNGEPFQQPSSFTADDRRALNVVLITRAGCDSATEAKAVAPFKGGDRAKTIAREFRNRRNAATRDVGPALACALLARHWCVDADFDHDRGRVRIPAVWFLPANHAPEEAHSLLTRNPFGRMLEVTATSDREDVPYLTVDGYSSYLRDLRRWEESGERLGKPEADAYASNLEVGVNVTGLELAADALIAAREAIAAARAAEAKAAAALQASETAQALNTAMAAAGSSVKPALVQQAQEAAAAARATQEAAAREAEAAKARAAEAAQRSAGRRKPGGATQQEQSAPAQNGNAGAAKTINDACDLLMRAAMRDDGRVTFGPVPLEHWQHLAAAIWRNPQLAHAFLMERETFLRAQEAEKHGAQKSK